MTTRAAIIDALADESHAPEASADLMIASLARAMYEEEPSLREALQRPSWGDLDPKRQATILRWAERVLLRLEGSPVSPKEPEPGLRQALERMLANPTTDIRTGNAQALLDKAKRSATQEVTITAQALRLLLPAIESEAVTQVIRTALRSDQPPSKGSEE